LDKFRREKFDILVTDFRMEGMNGLELARQIHATNPEIPVIIVTGYGPLDSCKDANVVLQKDSMFPALLEKIRWYLGETKPAGSAA
jgi:DNA-binding NtrC family response regulator